MLKKSNKVLFYIPPEIKYYFDLKSFNFFFFGIVGWAFQRLLKTQTFIYSEINSLICGFFISCLLFKNLIFGLIKTYFKYIQLRGRSFKFFFFYFKLILKLGFSHKLYYITPNDLYIKLVAKQVLKISSKSHQKLKAFFFDLESIRKFDIYKGKGLIYYKDTLILKANSKKTKV